MEVQIMERTPMENLCEVMAKNPEHLFDYISEHYQEFGKDDLMHIIREMDYSMEQAVRRYDIADGDRRRILSDAAEELADSYMIDLSGEEE